jgi:hypothetical protein
MAHLLVISEGGEEGVNKMLVADSIILFIVLVIFVLMSYVTIQVFKLVEYGDKRLMLMMIFLDFTLIGKLSSSAILTSLQLTLYSRSLASY